MWSRITFSGFSSKQYNPEIIAFQPLCQDLFQINLKKNILTGNCSYKKGPHKDCANFKTGQKLFFSVHQQIERL